MTLVIAQKTGGKVSLSSDSRMSFENGHFDFCIKVFSVPVKIFSATQSATGLSTLDFHHHFGLAVVRSFINAYTVKESIYELLQNLQYIPLVTDFSMDGISRLVYKVFLKMTEDLRVLLGEKGLCGLVLSGHCRVQGKIRVFFFGMDQDVLPYVCTYNEILIEDGIEFFGSGKEAAKKARDASPDLSPLHIIREVIRDDLIPTVGGGLQHGEFKEQDFQVYGVEDYELENDGTFGRYLRTLRGINMYIEDFEAEDSAFHIAYSFKQPFEKEIEEVWKR